MRKLLYLFMLITCVTLVACSENENKKKEIHASIVGSWRGNIGDGEDELWTFTKEGNGTKTLYASHYDPETKSFTYKLNGQNLSVHFVDWDEEDGSPDFNYTVLFWEDAISFKGEIFYEVKSK